MQIRAGTGGEEAALFVADLLRMYRKYAELQSWKIVHLSDSLAENGGLKEVIVQVGVSQALIFQELEFLQSHNRIQYFHKAAMLPLSHPWLCIP